MIRKGFLWVLALCVAALMPFCALADGSAALEAEMGYGGAVTYVRTLPVRVRLTNTGADASGMLVMDVNRGDNQFDRYQMPLSIAAGSTLEATLPVVLTQRQKTYTVSWMVDDQTVAQREITPAQVIAPSGFIVGTLGAQAQDFAYMNISKGSDPLSRGEYWTAVPLDEAVFPSDVEGLRFFDMLAVDGFDMSALSDQQRGVLDLWIKEGGIVLVGGGAGAAAAFPYFEQYTGISAGKLADGGDISSVLLKAFGTAGTPLGQSVMTVELEGASGHAVGEEPLIDTTRVEEGYVLTAAFALAEKPLSGWLGKNVVWQRMLIANTQGRYKAVMQSRQNNSYLSRDTAYADSNVTQRIGVPGDGALVLPLVILGLFVLLAGFGSYWLLKRLDRREWMWAVVPALAAAASLALWGASEGLSLNDPIAVYYTVVKVDENGVADSYSAVTAAQAERGPLTVSAGNGEVDIASYASYYVNSNSAPQDSAAQLRLTSTYGQDTSVTFPGQGTWNESYSFLVRDAVTEDMSGVHGSCRWEGDSLLCTVTNGSLIPLYDGVVLTDRGFAAVGELLPGQSATVTLKPDLQRAPGQPSRTDPVRDGVLLTGADLNSYSVYDFIERYAALDERRMTAGEYNEAYLRRALMNQRNYGMDGAMFLFVGFSDELAELDLSINDQPVSRTARRGVVQVDLSYDPVAEDGSVRFLRGQLPAYEAAAEGEGRPVRGEMLSRDRYRSFALITSPIFAFDVSAIPKGFELTGMDIAGRYAYYSYKVTLYDPATGEWKEFKTYTMDPSTGVGTAQCVLPELEAYVTDGYLYARFETYGTVESYNEVDSPALTIEGWVK